MGMAERIDGDATGEIEKSATVGRFQPDALAAFEGERSGRKRVVDM
jgi:hypothetical protein